MDSLNANYPKSLKYIDNDFDSTFKLDSAFPGKIIFETKSLSPCPKNIEKFRVNSNMKFKEHMNTNYSSIVYKQENEIHLNNNSVTVSKSPSLKLTNEFTVMTRIWQEKRSNDWVRLIGKGNFNKRNYGLWVYTDGRSLSQIQLGNNIFSNIWPNTPVIPLKKWTHLALTFKKNGKHTFYFNGNLFKSLLTTGTPYTDNEPLTLGGASFHTKFKGFIKDSFVFNKVLSDEEIKNMYNYGTLDNDQSIKVYNKQSIGTLKGKYDVSYRNNLRKGYTMDFYKNGKVRQSNNLGNTIFDEVIQTKDIKKKCSEKRDQDKTFYIENTYGKGKYECLKIDGNNIIGSHYIPNNTFWGSVKYTPLKENNLLRNKINNNGLIKSKINNEFMKKSIKNIKKKIYNDNSQMNTDTNSTFETFNNSEDINELIEYNKELSKKQEVQKDKIELIREKETNLQKVNALLKTSNDRNSFKKKIILTLIALIFLLFILSLSTYIYFVRDFKIEK